MTPKQLSTKYKNEFEPVIKWSGSKRSVAPILGLLIPESKRYIEPFVGSGAMLPYRLANKALAADIISELIELWKIIRDDPALVSEEYALRWKKLQREGHKYYYKVRDSFNASRDPLDFLFLTRTCVNGLIRFNSHGGFNNSLHHSRPGIAPERLRVILFKWSGILKNVKFIVADYRKVFDQAGKNDFIFLDPPYVGTKGRYTTADFSIKDFYDQLEKINNVGTKWMLTFDGSAGARIYHSGIPQELFKIKLDLPTGNSPFTKIMRTGIDRVVESVYLNYKPAPQMLAQVTNYFNNKICRTLSNDMQESLPFIDVKLERKNDVEIAMT